MTRMLPQTLPHDLILPVYKLVGYFPDAVDLLSDEDNDCQNHRNKGQHGRRQRSASFRRDSTTPPKNSTGIMMTVPDSSAAIQLTVSTSWEQRGRQAPPSQLAEFLKAHLVDLAEHGGAEVGARKTLPRRWKFSIPQEHRSQPHQRHRRHDGAASDDVGKIRPINAPVENFALMAGSSRSQNRGYRHGNGRGEQPSSRLQIMHHFFFIFLPQAIKLHACAAP